MHVTVENSPGRLRIQSMRHLGQERRWSIGAVKHVSALSFLESTLDLQILPGRQRIQSKLLLR